MKRTRKETRLSDKEWLKVFIFNSIILFAIYGIMLTHRMSIDAYSVFVERPTVQHLRLGRLSCYFTLSALHVMGIDPVSDQQILTALFIFTLSACTTLLYYQIKTYMNTENVRYLLYADFSLILAVVNVSYGELFYFSECVTTWGGAILFAVLAVCIFFHTTGLKQIILTFLSLCISLNFYQAMIGVFVIYGLTFILLKHNLELSKKLIGETFLLLVIGAVASLLTIKTLDILISLGITNGSERNPSFNIAIIWQNINGILRSQKGILLDGFSYIKNWVLFALMAAITILFSALHQGKYSIKSVLLVIVFLAGGYVIVFAPHILTTTLWIAPRTVLSFFSLFTMLGVLTVYIYCNKNRYIPDVFFVGLIAFILLNSYHVQNIAADQVANNRMDQVEAQYIMSEIAEYEQSSGNTVDTICYRNDKGVTYINTGIHAYMDINVRASSCSWAHINRLTYHSGRKFAAVPMNETQYAKIFGDGDWTSFEKKEQLYFDGTTMYWAIY